MPDCACIPVAWSTGEKRRTNEPLTWLTHDRHDAREGLQDHVVTLGLSQGTGPSVAGDAAVDEIGIVPLECFVIDPQALRHAGSKAFHDNVSIPCQPTGDISALR